MNPNEYNDEGYTKGVNDLVSAISLLWSSGATEEDLEREIENAKENAGMPV